MIALYNGNNLTEKGTTPGNGSLPCSHRQYVFSIPKILRRFFFYDRKLLDKLSQGAVKSLTKFFQLTLGKKTGIPGVVVALQTFRDYGRWHPHLHALVVDGLFLESGYFFVMPKANLSPLAEFSVLMYSRC